MIQNLINNLIYCLDRKAFCLRIQQKKFNLKNYNRRRIANNFKNKFLLEYNNNDNSKTSSNKNEKRK